MTKSENDAHTNMSPAERLIRQTRYKQFPARLELVLRDHDTVEVRNIVAPNPGNGEGRATMKAVIEEADDLGVTLELWPMWDEDIEGALYQTDLENWYLRLGFNVPARTADAAYFIRMPQPKQQQNLDAGLKP